MRENVHERERGTMIQRAAEFIRKNLILALIVVGFVILASTGLFYNFGLATTVGDEAPSMSAALKMIADHSLRPAYPTLYYPPVNVFAVFPFVLAGVSTLPLLGVPFDPSAIKEFVILDYAKLLPWVRLASVFYGALSVYVLYQIALRVLRRREVALLASYFFATSLLFIQLAHFGRVWSVQVLLILCGIWMSLRVFDAPSLRRYLIVGMATLLAFGVNVIGGVVYISFAAAHFLANRGRSLSEILFHRGFLVAHMVIVGGVGMLYYLNPYGLENYVRIVRRFFRQ